MKSVTNSITSKLLLEDINIVEDHHEDYYNKKHLCKCIICTDDVTLHSSVGRRFDIFNGGCYCSLCGENRIGIPICDKCTSQHPVLDKQLDFKIFIKDVYNNKHCIECEYSSSRGND